MAAEAIRILDEEEEKHVRLHSEEASTWMADAKRANEEGADQREKDSTSKAEEVEAARRGEERSARLEADRLLAVLARKDASSYQLLRSVLEKVDDSTSLLRASREADLLASLSSRVAPTLHSGLSPLPSPGFPHPLLAPRQARHPLRPSTYK